MKTTKKTKPSKTASRKTSKKKKTGKGTPSSKAKKKTSKKAKKKTSKKAKKKTSKKSKKKTGKVKKPAGPARTKTGTRKQTPEPPVVDPGRVSSILDTLSNTYTDATSALNWETPLQLLVATILSAQCTDVRVNIVTPELFSRYPAAQDLARAPLEDLEQLVHSTGFFRSKARSIKNSCAVLVEQHGGEVPSEIDQLILLPGVARKTANVVLGTGMNIAAGVVVDTHVKRISNRLGLTTEHDPKRIERDLMSLIPRERWILFAHQVILHGRALCKSRKPLCGECPLAPHCPTAPREG